MTFQKKTAGVRPSPHQLDQDNPELFTRKVRAHAYALLAGRELSQKQMITRLLKYGAPLELATSITQELVQQGYQSDERMAECVVNSHLRNGRGPNKIRQKLYDCDLSESLLEHPLTELDWLTRAKALRIKRFGDELPLDAKERARQCRFLAYRGFSTDICLKVVLGKYQDSDEL